MPRREHFLLRFSSFVYNSPQEGELLLDLPGNIMCVCQKAIEALFVCRISSFRRLYVYLLGKVQRLGLTSARRVHRHLLTRSYFADSGIRIFYHASSCTTTSTICKVKTLLSYISISKPRHSSLIQHSSPLLGTVKRLYILYKRAR